MVHSFQTGSVLLWFVGLSVPHPACGRLFQILSTAFLRIHKSFCSSLALRHSPSLFLHYHGETVTQALCTVQLYKLSHKMQPCIINCSLLYIKKCFFSP